MKRSEQYLPRSQIDHYCRYLFAINVIQFAERDLIALSTTYIKMS